MIYKKLRKIVHSDALSSKYKKRVIIGHESSQNNYHCFFNITIMSVFLRKNCWDSRISFVSGNLYLVCLYFSRLFSCLRKILWKEKFIWKLVRDSFKRPVSNICQGLATGANSFSLLIRYKKSQSYSDFNSNSYDVKVNLGSFFLEYAGFLSVGRSFAVMREGDICWKKL